MAVFTRLGGTAAMAEWAEENRMEFYRLYARLIPTEVGASVNGTIIVQEIDPTLHEPGYQRRGKVSCESVALETHHRSWSLTPPCGERL